MRSPYLIDILLKGDEEDIITKITDYRIMEETFKYVVAKYFFADYCPWVRNFKHKLRGIDGNGKPIEFSKEDKKYIKRGIKQMLSDLSK